MSHTDPHSMSSQAAEFATTLTERIDDGYVHDMIGLANEGDLSHVDIFKGGFAVGAAEGYKTIMPRAQAMGRTLKSVYMKLEAMMLKHEDIAFMADLAALRGEIAAYMMTEADAVLESTRKKLSKMSGVPEDYIDDKVLISEIPSSILTDIGKRAAEANIRMFAIYAVSGCRNSKEGKVPTMEELVELVRNDKIKMNTNVGKTEYSTLLPGYGAAQVRNVRDSYRKVLVGLDHYRDIHSTDAKRVTEGLMEKIKKGVST